MTDEPIPVSLALRAVERALRECDAATPGPWLIPAAESLGDTVTPSRFAALARAGFRGTLEFLLAELQDVSPYIGVTGSLISAVAPLIAHYDATAPGWRTE